MPTKETDLKRKTKAYLAGLLDSDGCISITKQEEHATVGSWNYGTIVHITNKSEELMKWLRTLTGVPYRSLTPSCFRWQISRKEQISSFITLVYPYLLAKKPEADVMREYLSLNGSRCPEKREELFLRIKYLREQECVTTNSSSIAPLKVLRPYLAGLFDGEGTVILGKRKPKGNKSGSYYTCIAYESSCKSSVKFFQTLFGGKIEKDSHEVILSCDKWTIDRKENKENFLLQMLPYVIVKRPKALIVLEYLRLGRSLGKTTERREELYQMGEALKIESELRGDTQSGLAVTPEGLLQTQYL